MANRRPRATAVNRSKWRDEWVQVVFRWLWKRLKRPPLRTDYSFQIRDGYATHGRAGTLSGWMRMPRRQVGTQDGLGQLRRDRRYAWAPEYEIRNRLEGFVFLMAHELRHGHPDNYALYSTGRNQGAEHDANHWAFEQVEAFRQEWPALRADILKMHRDAAAHRRAKKEQAAAARAAKNCPFAKLEKVLARKRAWETKAKRAATALKKLKRSESALRRSIERKAAKEKA